MKYTKRMLALFLALCMILTSVPMTAKAAGTLVDAAIFCSDVHGSTSDTSSVFSGIAKSGVTYSTASFVGDTATTQSDVTSSAQSALGDANVESIYSFGSHDDEDGCTINDVTGLLYGDGENEKYYIYAISQSSMQSSSADTSGFTSTIEGLDQTKPLFIISHMPLHARRGDNKGAAKWYNAISAAAEKNGYYLFLGP